MLTENDAQNLIKKDSTPKVETTPTPEKTFQDAIFGGSTSKIARNLFGYLNEKDRNALATTNVDARRFNKVDQALTNDDFKISLMSEILSVLEDPAYADRLSVSRNPSGFLRLNNDLISLIKHPEILNAIPNHAELRLNFWPGDLYQHLGAKLEPETGHSHPRGFTSMIVTGGYKHDIHFASNKPNNPDDHGFMVFRGKKINGENKFEKLEGAHYLANAIRETFEPKSEYSYYSTQLIHQVAERIPAKTPDQDHGTLTINVVFKPLESAPIPQYDIYVHDEKSLVEKYDQLQPDLAKNTLEIVKGLLRNKIAELTESQKAKAVSLDSVKASNSPATLFAHKDSKDSFEAVVEAVHDDEEESVNLPNLSKKKEPVKQANVPQEETTDTGLTVNLY